jgi:predicted permease
MPTDLFHRCRALFRRRAVEREIDEELRFHLDRRIEAYEREGVGHAEAVRRARLEFGGLDQIKEEYRDALGVRLVDDLRQDLRLAARSLRATPVVTAALTLSLALAIGANTAMFSILNGLLLRPLPVREPERLALITDVGALPRARVWSYAIWDQIRQRPQLFDDAVAWSFTRFNLAPGGEAQFVEGLWASGRFFETLGVPTVVGRPFSDLDDQGAGGPDGPVAVISYGYWQRQFGGAADVVGQSVRLNAVSFTIVGVTPPDFFGIEVGRTFDIIVPLRTEALIRGPDSAIETPGTNFLSIMARLESGQSLEHATAALRSAQSEIRLATLGPWGQDVVNRYLTAPLALIPAVTGFSNLRLRYQRPLLVISAAVALVLLIGCVNVANLMLARGTARRHELAVRRALGASRSRLSRQLITESLGLSGAGAALGLLLAGYGSRVFVSQLSTPANLVFVDVSIDGRVLGFTVALTVLTALLFGTAPAFRAARVQPMDALKGYGRASTEQAHRGVMGWLVGVQVALSVVLVVAAGLFVRSFVSLTTRHLGFQSAQVLVVNVDAQRANVDPALRVPLYERMRHAVMELPNVADAAVSFLTPVGGGGFTPAVEIAGDTASGGRESAAITFPPNGEVSGNLISPRWFGTFGTPLIAGRDFTDSDRRGAPRVAIVNEAFARRFLGRDHNPIGRTITLYPNTPQALTSIEIVGVAADAVYGSAREVAPPTWYVPIAQFDLPGFSFATARLSVRVRTGSPLLLTKTVAAAIGAVNPDVTLTFRPLADQVRSSLTQERLMAQVAGFLGVLALLLSGVGLYGVTAYALSCRRVEIGIRLALGATSTAVVELVLAWVLRLVCAGIIVGVGLSLWASRFVGGLLYDLPPRDPTTLMAAALVLSLIAAVAGWVPARRAGRIDPVEVLRQS